MAARKRTNFTERQKALIYARDRATCAFSGVSLWIPDHGLTPEWDTDWADHLKPSARGGLSTLENGACVSSTYNSKKRDNGSDTTCFFHEGRITRAYVRVFGLPTDDVLRALQRRAAIVPADWLFNRALGNSLIALGWRFREERGAWRHKRDDEYWIAAAWKQYLRWSRSRVEAGFTSRGLVVDPPAFGADLLFELEHVGTEARYRDWLEALWPSYVATARMLDAFDAVSCDEERREIVERGGERAAGQSTGSRRAGDARRGGSGCSLTHGLLPGTRRAATGHGQPGDALVVRAVAPLDLETRSIPHWMLTERER